MPATTAADEENFYKDLFNRYKVKYDLYAKSWRRWKTLDFSLFTIPLIIVQVLNAIIPIFLKDPADAEKMKIISSTISAVSAAVISIRGKLAWDERSQQHGNIAKMYANLKTESFAKIQEAKTRTDADGDADTRAMDMKTFLQQCQSQEKTAVAGADIVISSDARKVDAKLDDDISETGDKKRSGIFWKIIYAVGGVFSKNKGGGLPKQIPKEYLDMINDKINEAKAQGNGFVNQAMDTAKEQVDGVVDKANNV